MQPFRFGADTALYVVYRAYARAYAAFDSFVIVQSEWRILYKIFQEQMTDKAAVNPRPSPYGEISQAALLCPDVIYVLLQSPVSIVYFLFLFLRSVDIHKWQTDV